MNEHLDEKDQAILQTIMVVREKYQSPRIGDYVVFATGQLERFSHNWDDCLQTSPSGSIFLFSNGQGSFSGGLNPAIPLSSLSLTKAVLPGDYWFFHHGFSGAGRGVHFDLACRVYETCAPYKGYLGADFKSKRSESLKVELKRQLEVSSKTSLKLIGDRAYFETETDANAVMAMLPPFKPSRFLSEVDIELGLGKPRVTEFQHGFAIQLGCYGNYYPATTSDFAV